MRLELLERLIQSKEEYVKFIQDIAMGKYSLPEEQEWLELFGRDRERMVKVMVKLAELLYKSNRTIVNPARVIVVPRFPLSKQPMISWGDLKGEIPQSHRATYLRYLVSKAGKLINSAIIARNFVVVDVDGEVPGGEKIFDVKTKRGYHKIYYLENTPAVTINKKFKHVIVCGERVEIFSGPNFLLSNPLQSRYLAKIGDKYYVKSYKIISRRAYVGFVSGDLSVLSATPSEIEADITNILEHLGCDRSKINIKILTADPEQLAIDISRGPKRESIPNKETLPLVGDRSYEEFKRELQSKINALPNCVRNTLFGFIEKGYRWYHLRFILPILHRFVFMTEENLKRFIEDFSQRSNSTLGDVNKWIYDSKYFSGKIEFMGKTVLAATKVNPPKEVWDVFEQLGYCSSCPLANTCAGKSTGERMKIILNYISTLLGENP